MVEDSSPEANVDPVDLDLTGLIKALDNEESSGVVPTSKTPSPFDPNATMDYQEAGMPFPELPFADSNSGILFGLNLEELNSQEEPPAKRKSPAAQSKSPAVREPQKKTSRVPAHANRSGTPAASRKPSAQTSKRPSAAAPRKSPDQAPRKSPAQTPKKSPAQTPKKSPAQTQKPAPTLAPLKPSEPIKLPQGASSYQPMRASQPAYKIRGGGRRRGIMTRSPVAIIAAALFLAVGVGVVFYATNSLMGAFSTTGTGTEFNLTKAQTREAIDRRLPVLIYYVDLTIEDTVASLTDAGHFVFSNDRYQPDSLDTGAVTGELVSMPRDMTSEQMSGYYEGGFNAYSVEELTEYFNGAFMFDLARGELGSWNKLRYVNFNATSIEDEMTHLATLQQLSGDTVTISAQGTDSRGNRVIQGQKVIDGERVLYFKIAACLFKDVYFLKSLTGDSVYITCTVATYDFYSGVDTIKPA